MSFDPTRYRVVDFIGGRILEAREMLALQNMTSGIDSAGATVVDDLSALYREGATLNVTPAITLGTRTVTLTPTNGGLPMQVFVRGRWESFESGEAPPITLGSSQFVLYLNWVLNIVTSSTDTSLVDADTSEPTANMGQLVLSVSATDTSGVSLVSGQYAKNTSPIVLFEFSAASGAFLSAGQIIQPVIVDNVNPPALATEGNSGLVNLTTSTSSGGAASSDDPRLSDTRTPTPYSVVDVSVRAPVPPGGNNSDGTPIYSIGSDPGGISAAKIIWQDATTRVSDFLAGVKASIASVVATIAAHIGAPLGLSNTHPMPTATQVGAAPLSHVNLPLGIPGSHPALVNSDTGGYVLNQDPGTAAAGGSAANSAYAVVENGITVAGIQHNGDFASLPLYSVVMSPGGSPLRFTGNPTGVVALATVVADHVNQTDGSTNPHGTLLTNLITGTPSVGSILIWDGTSFQAMKVSIADVTSSRSGNTIYRNTTVAEMSASGFTFSSGSSVGNIDCLIGPTSPPTISIFGTEATATVSGGAIGFIFPSIPVGWYYQMVPVGAAAGEGLGKWIERTYVPG